MSLTDIFVDYWWILLVVILAPYSLYFIYNLLVIKLSRNLKKKKKISSKVVTVEEETLGIRIMNEDIPFYKERIENLIVMLNESQGEVKINAIEALVLVEFFSEEIEIDKDGILVIDLKTANMFSKKIYEEPMKFIKYIKSVEKKLDINNHENKIELGDALYMMRNAKKFGLYIDEDESDFEYVIKSKIHNENYKDVVIKIIDKEYELLDTDIGQKTNIIIKNTYKPDEDKKQGGHIENKTLPTHSDNNIQTCTKLDDGSVVIITVDGKKIHKTDQEIISIIDLRAEEDEDEKDKKKKNTNSDSKKDLQKLLNKDDEVFEAYKERFGALDSEEKKGVNYLKDRSKTLYFDEQLTGKLSFDSNTFQEQCFFKNGREFEYVIASMFDKENCMRNGLPHIYIGDVEFNNRTVRFLTIDINYFFNFLYQTLKREHREDLFQFIYKKNKTINIENANKIIENINNGFNIFMKQREQLTSIVVYEYKSKTIKCEVIRIDIEVFQKLLNDSDNIREKYSSIKLLVDGLISTKEFGPKAESAKADISINQDTFFRQPKTLDAQKNNKEDFNVDEIFS